MKKSAAILGALFFAAAGAAPVFAGDEANGNRIENRFDRRRGSH